MKKNKYDLVSVLGYDFIDGKNLPEHVSLRMQKVVEIYNATIPHPHIALCGKWGIYRERLPRVPSTTEAEAMRKMLIQLGVPAHHIIKEEASKDTIGNAYYLKTKITIPHGFRNILVVCADYHLKRTEFIFKKVFGEEYLIDFIHTPSNKNNDKEFIQSQEKIFQDQKNFLNTMKTGDHSFLEHKLYSHPFYQEKS